MINLQSPKPDLSSNFLIFLFWNHSRHIYGDFHSKALKYIV